MIPPERIASSPASSDLRWKVAFVAILMAMMTMQMASLGFSPLLPDIQREFRISYAQVGLFTGIYGLISILVSYPAGLLARRFGEKPVLLTGLLVIVAGLSILAIAPSFPVALGARVVWLVGYRAAFVCVMIAVALTAPSALKGRTMGILGAVGAFASVVGAPFGGQMGRLLGWRGGFAGYALIALIGAIFFALLYKKKALVLAVARRPGDSDNHPAAYKVPAVWLMAAGSGLINMGGFAVTFFVPAIVKGIFHLGSLDAAYLISTAYLVAMFLNLLTGYIADRIDRVNVMIGLAVLLVLPALALQSTNLTVFRFAVIAVIALGHAATNQSYAVVGAVLKGRDTGPAMGIVSLGAGIYAYLGPQMLGLLRDWTGGFSAGFCLLAGAACFGALLMLLLKRSVTNPDAKSSVGMSNP